MKRTFNAPRLSSLELFASALFVSLGFGMQAGCTTEVTVEGSGGAGGGGTSSSSSSGNTTATSSSGSSTSSTSTSTSSSTSSNSSGFVPGTSDCLDPQPIIIDGIDVGVDICAGGQMRRREAVACPAGTIEPNPCCGVCPEGSICDTSGEVACLCVPKCVQDADCMTGQLCLCGPQGGRCITSTCKTSAECVAGQECTSYDPTQGCLYLNFACTTPQDTCSGDKDCNSQVPFSFCSMQADGHRECQLGGCAIGRPFLIDGEARTANLETREDWCETNTTTNIDNIDPILRQDLAEAWEHTARMEHASIAAFARFALELLSLGAPSDLIMRTNSAMVDETNHARMAFALASAYRGQPVGPGRLSMDGAMDEGDDLASILRRVIREGCVGETVAAVEAGEGAGRARDLHVRKTLETISTDESMHADLAWRTVLWAQNTFGETARVVIGEEIARLADEMATVQETRRTKRDEVLLDHGVVTANVRAQIRRATLKSVVLPGLKMISGIGSSATDCGSSTNDGCGEPIWNIGAPA